MMLYIPKANIFASWTQDIPSHTCTPSLPSWRALQPLLCGIHLGKIQSKSYVTQLKIKTLLKIYHKKSTAGEPSVSSHSVHPQRVQRVHCYDNDGNGLIFNRSFQPRSYAIRLGHHHWDLIQIQVWIQKTHEFSINSTECSSFPTA